MLAPEKSEDLALFLASLSGMFAALLSDEPVFLSVHVS